MRTSTRPTADHGIPRVDWYDLGPQFMNRWGRKPDGGFDPEHLTVYGKSGGGKTHFVQYVLNQRAMARGSAVVGVVTKRADKTIERWAAETGWPILSKWPPDYGQDQVIFWAKPTGISLAHRIPQRKKIRELMDALWVPDSNTIVYWDELTYIEKNLNLKTEIESFYRDGRSHGLTNVASMQRPAYVSRLAHSEPGWSVAFPAKDADDRDRVAEVFGDRALYREVIKDLDPWSYEFVIKHERSGAAYISSLPPPRRPVSRTAGRSVRSRSTRTNS